ncbi:U3 small nucleolar RNA-associated protein MPP10 [Sporothrix schenckii 1099-18]|uniref:U3 small nucleolar RNA-associated protein MPP10 n=1 Tax=Sporothrix schenckii 1099-18 TaxID=1397361 RepID=A0A0F2LXY3_SPOSC|nr:U3 small nucleolar RNA-associated protein MPP10 [Sporothrix schenckii 1099-18]KJR81350.1 U3 small nucleolar RNA-associated protein MPP10 [Sporothrix schenckii 1099-18]
MADSSTSSLTSTSHTLTIAAPYGIMAPGSGSMPSLGDIASALAFRDTTRRKPREAFLTPNAALSTASSEITQVALGTFAGLISDEQQERLRQMHAATAARKKRKRASKGAAAVRAAGDNDDDDDENDKFVRPVGPILKIRRVHVNGFEVPQIWQQSNRILATSTQQSQSILDRLEQEDESDADDDDNATPTNGVYAGSDVEEDGEDEENRLEDDLAVLEAEEDEDDDDLSMGDDGEDDFVEDDEAEEDEDEDDEVEDTGHGPAKELVEDADGLNDGFFDINEFNKQSQWFEAQDARADPNTDAASDDDELDWHSDPFAVPVGGKKAKKDGKAATSKSKSKSKKGRGSHDSDDDDDDNGAGGEDDDEEDGPPIFGNMDLDAPSGESDIEDMDDTTNGGLAGGFDDVDLTANDIFYKDFFAPPAKKRGDRDRPGRQSAKTNGDDSANKPFQPDEADVQRAIKDVRRDLFEQISDASGDEDSDGIDALSDASAGDVRSRRSAHERRQAKILAEIRRLEAEAVKEKNWTVSGEASASARPVNSLLEEDLDFEHIGKPVPVITQEITEDIEALVKRRILEQSFDEVCRRYGTGFGEDADGTRRGLVEIDDSQAKKGLAAVYEEEHQQAAHPDTYVSQSDERVQAEEREVERMWLDVSAKLDALSNWHYKPRPAAPQMSVVADVATVTMEDAQPATAQGVSGGASMLAPQEVYKPGADKKDKEKDVVVVARSGLPVARDEMTREEKLRRRRRNKERIRKSGSGMTNGNGTAAGGASAVTSAGSGAAANASQADTIATLKRAGVKVIGRKGELQDVEGNKPQVSRALSSGNFKL